MFAQAGKKLLFMGGEFGQVREWDHESSLDWDVKQYPMHSGLQRCVEDLNRTYREHPALHELDTDSSGFEWIDCNDNDSSVISFLRKAKFSSETIAVVCNFTPVPHVGYRVGVPSGGFWRELLNSDATEYGGSGMGNLGGAQAVNRAVHGRPYSLELTLPPLGALFLTAE
jgi:1,4-alpha-glucan branching enzyme